jgi:hypothetical protein
MLEGRTLQDLLAVEDHEGILDFSCRETRVPLWPLLRNRFLRAAMSDAIFTRSLVATRRGTAVRKNVMRAARTVVGAAVHNARTGDGLGGEILITSGAAGLMLRNQAWFNRLTDHFASVAPDETVILEDAFRWHLRLPRHHGHILFHTPYFVLGEAAGWFQVRSRHLREAEALIAFVRERARRLLGWDLGTARAGAYSRLVAREAAAMPVLRRLYAELLERLGTRVLIKEMGCYGRSALFIATARDMGVAVAEHQHGLVSAGHDAYNIAPTLARSGAFRRTLPEHLLAYGAWWGEQISVPVACVAVGNPHRSEQIASLGRVAQDDRQVLILGDGIETGAYLALSDRLAQRLAPRFRIVFRPHPHERDSVEVARAEAAGRLRVDRASDIYRSLASSGAVVSEASTGLFEALGLAGRIIALDSARGRFSLPRHPFETARDADELADRLDGQVQAPTDPGLVSRIWSSGWRNNYRAFIEQRPPTPKLAAA